MRSASTTSDWVRRDRLDPTLRRRIDSLDNTTTTQETSR